MSAAPAIAEAMAHPAFVSAVIEAMRDNAARAARRGDARQAERDAQAIKDAARRSASAATSITVTMGDF